MKKTLLLLPVIFLAGCASKEQHKAAKEVAAIWQAQGYSVGTSSKADSDHGSKKALTLTLQDFKALKDKFPKENIGCISALQYIRNLPPEEYKDFDRIEITLKHNSETFEKSYSIPDILKANEILKVADDFSKKIISGNLDGLENYFEKKWIPDSIAAGLKTTILLIDSASGRPDKANLIGYEFNTLEETKEPVLVMHTEISNDTTYSIYKLIFATADKKIVYMGINEK
jgi:hypothetical protein